MTDTITINIADVLWFFGAVTAIGVGLSWLRKAFAPLKKPINNLESKILAIETDSKKHDTYFANDKLRLDKHDESMREMREDIQELKSDIKALMKSTALLMKHTETGNCTGEVAEGRRQLEEHLIENR